MLLLGRYDTYQYNMYRNTSEREQLMDGFRMYVFIRICPSHFQLVYIIIDRRLGRLA